MFNGSDCGRKSQLSGILTEPLNPRDTVLMKFFFAMYGTKSTHLDIFLL